MCLVVATNRHDGTMKPDVTMYYYLMSTAYAYVLLHTTEKRFLIGEGGTTDHMCDIRPLLGSRRDPCLFETTAVTETSLMARDVLESPQWPSISTSH